MQSRVLILMLLGLLVVSCEKENPASEVSKRPDAGAPKAEALDPDIAQAVAAASARAPYDPKAGDAQGGPPPNGIFVPGAADKEIAKGQLPKLTLGSAGSDPKLNLAFVPPKPGVKQSGNIQVVQQNEGNGLPIDFAVTFEAQKPKPEALDRVPISVRVTGAKISVTGAPKELETQVAKLKGAKVDYEVDPNGAGTGYRYEIPKTAPPELADAVRSLTDVLALVTLPLPSQPVGAGGYWMVTSRDGVSGLDLVTYRMVKLESVEGNKATLNLNTKRYAATPVFEPPWLPPDAPHSMAEFQSLAEGSLIVESGKAFPQGGSQNSVFGAALKSPTNPKVGGMLEVRTRAELKFGG